MFGEGLFKLKNYLQDNGIFFCYSGYMTEDTLVGIGDAIKKKLSLDDADRQTSRGVFSVFVEQVQNVIRYSAEIEGGDGSPEIRYGILVVGRQDDDFFVICGNMVHGEDVPRLKEALTKIQQMDPAELKKAWKDQLRAGPPEGSKGAGIGFIDIARRAKKGIEFEFQEVDQEMCFFTLKAYT